MNDPAYRIAIFSDSTLPVLNGVSVSIDMLVRELRGLGHSVHVFTAAHFRYRDPDPNTYRFFAAQTPWTKGYPIALPPFYPFIRHFRRERFDIVHTHTPFTIGFVGLRWAESHGIPIVSTYHTLYDKYAHYIPYFPKWYVRYKTAKHTNYYFNRVSQVITPTESSLRWLRRHSVTRPIHVIPTAPLPPPMLDRAELRHAMGLAPHQRVLLYVGRIAHEKNMSMLIEAVGRLLPEDPSLVFWLVGDGPAHEACRDQVRALGIGDRVRFIGNVPRAEVDRYFAIAHLFVFASMTETQGLVVGEAMQHGLPSVVVQGGGASLAVRDHENGLIVRNDAEQFAEAARRLLGDDNLYARLSSGALAQARSYTPAHMAQAVLRVYDIAMGRQPQPESHVVRSL